MGHRGIAAALVALAVALLAPAVANAAFLSNVVAKPVALGTAADCGGAATDAPAGSHRDFCLSFGFGADYVKDTVIDLPAGVIGDPSAAPVCQQSDFAAGNCAADTQVGDVATNATVLVLPTDLTGKVYNLKPNPDEPARLGIDIDPSQGLGVGPVRLQSSVRVRLDDYGLRSTVKDIPNTFHVNSMALKLWGRVPDTTSGTPFVSLPTRCDVPAVATITATTYSGTSDTKTASFAPTDCEHVPFTPSLEVGPKDVHADTPGSAFAILKIPTADTGTGNAARRQSYVRQVKLQLPEGLMLNPPLGNGLIPCTEAQFGQFEDRPPACPASSEIGTVAFKTPIFAQPLTGKVYFGEGTPGHLLRNFVSVEDPRLRVKLIGDVTVDPATGAILNVFNDSPQVPFETFTFTYQDESSAHHAVLTAPTTCGTRTVVSPMVPWSGTAAQAPFDTFDTIGCVSPVPFAPTLGATTSTTQAGGDTGLKIHIARPDKQQRLKTMTVSLPPGLTGRLTTVPQCKVADARAAKCPATTQVGTASVAVGTGATPLTLPGTVYLTEGYDGSLAGLAVTVNTKIPALDLGIVTVMNKIVLRPDTGIDVVTEPLPQLLQGIPTVYRSIDLDINKPGFMLNATSCADQAIHATFTAVGGATATSDAPYKATGCDQLPFAPKITAALGAPKENGVGGHPPLTVTIEQADGQAAMAKTIVGLPIGMGVDLKNLTSICTEAQFNSQTCPAPSRIGSVSAITPLLPQTLSGGAYLIQGARPGALPRLGLDLSLVRLIGDVAIGKRLVTSFNTVPDVPLHKLVLTLTGGPKAALMTNLDLCTATTPPSLEAQFVSQSGVTKNATIAPAITGCNPINGTGTLTGAAKRRPTLKLSVVSSQPLKELRVKLPSQLRVVGKRVKRARLLLGGKRTRGTKVRWSKGYVTFRAGPGTVFRAPQVTIPRTMLKQRRKIRAGSKLTVRVVGITSRHKVLRGSVPVTVVG